VSSPIQRNKIREDRGKIAVGKEEERKKHLKTFASKPVTYYKKKTRDILC